MEKEEKEISNLKKCKKCGSTQTYYRIKSKDRYCRSCNYTENLEEKE